MAADESVTIEIVLTPEAYYILRQVAEIRGVRVRDVIYQKFDFYEKLKDRSKAEIKGFLQGVRRDHLDKLASHAYDTHPLNEEVLRVFKNGNVKTLVWRTCPVQEAELLAPGGPTEKHLGEYWFAIREMNRFNCITSEKIAYRKTLRALKKSINRELGRDRYVVR